MAAEPSAVKADAPKPAAASNQAKPSQSEPKVTTERLGYTKEFSPTTYKAEDCLQKNSFEACQKLAAGKKSENKLSEAYLYAKKSCELAGEGCVGLYETASLLGPDTVTGLKKFLEDQCVKSAEACNEVSSIYENQKDYPNAIDYARKYYLKSQKGNFTKFSYLYGDKNEAFATSLNECNKNAADCVVYIKSMPDHPQMAKLVSQAELDCNQNPAGGSCVDVGLYYNKKAIYKKSSQLWGISCKAQTAQACMYLMGSRGAMPEEQLAAYEKFCSLTPTLATSTLKKLNCKVPLPKEIPSQLKVYSEYELSKAEKNKK
jgi:hypothetical protein